jgi:hypothetical protein
MLSAIAGRPLSVSFRKISEVMNAAPVTGGGKGPATIILSLAGKAHQSWGIEEAS